MTHLFSKVLIYHRPLTKTGTVVSPINFFQCQHIPVLVTLEFCSWPQCTSCTRSCLNAFSIRARALLILFFLYRLLITQYDSHIIQKQFACGGILIILSNAFALINQFLAACNEKDLVFLSVNMPGKAMMHVILFTFCSWSVFNPIVLAQFCCTFCNICMRKIKLCFLILHI